MTLPKNQAIKLTITCTMVPQLPDKANINPATVVEPALLASQPSYSPPRHWGGPSSGLTRRETKQLLFISNSVGLFHQVLA